MNRFTVVVSHNFDAETRVISLPNEDAARSYLRWVWEKYYNEEIASGSRLVENACWCEYDNALITWEDGCYTKFDFVIAYSPEPDFIKQFHDVVSDLSERTILSVGPEEIDYAIDVQGLSDFFKATPNAKEDALACAYERLTSYVDRNDFLTNMVIEAVEDTAERYGYKE